MYVFWLRVDYCTYFEKHRENKNTEKSISDSSLEMIKIYLTFNFYLEFLHVLFLPKEGVFFFFF